MKLIKSILATAIIVVICWLTGRIFSFTGFVFSWIINFLLMAWYTYLSDQWQLSLNSDYFKKKAFEKEGRIYKWLGVNLYRKILLWSGWEKITRKKNPVKKDLIHLRRSEYNSRSSEFAHLLIAFIVLIVTIVVSGSLNDAKWLLITNLLLNIYPVMVQRYNRPRLVRLIKKIEKQNSREVTY